ncbi:hypothetical protein FG95_01702 [Sphingopyxis sp. LC363]|nr:hypothetical protein FG95_01702 [Sphingopyxis sp. LC363]
MALEVVHRRDDELMSGLMLEFEQLRVQRGFLGRGDDVGLIDDGVARELGEGLRRGGGGDDRPGNGKRQPRGQFALMQKNSARAELVEAPFFLLLTSKERTALRQAQGER